MSESGSPQNRVEAAGAAALSIIERAAQPVLTDLRAAHPAAADLLARALRDGTLAAPLSPKPLSKLAAELLESLAASGDTDAD
jgi:hypothetical protein